VIRELYPDLEMIFVNQHMDMRELQVEASPEISALFAKNKGTLKEELTHFREKFVF